MVLIETERNVWEDETWTRLDKSYKIVALRLDLFLTLRDNCFWPQGGNVWWVGDRFLLRLCAVWSKTLVLTQASMNAYWQLVAIHKKKSGELKWGKITFTVTFRAPGFAGSVIFYNSSFVSMYFVLISNVIPVSFIRFDNTVWLNYASCHFVPRAIIVSKILQTPKGQASNRWSHQSEQRWCQKRVPPLRWVTDSFPVILLSPGFLKLRCSEKDVFLSKDKGVFVFRRKRIVIFRIYFESWVSHQKEWCHGIRFELLMSRNSVGGRNVHLKEHK